MICQGPAQHRVRLSEPPLIWSVSGQDSEQLTVWPLEKGSLTNSAVKRTFLIQWANASQQLNVCSTVLCMELTCVIRSDVEIYITPWDWEGNIILIYNILKCFIKCKEFCDFFKVHFSNFKIFAFNNIEIITIYHHFKTSEKHFARCMNCEKISFSLF